jgi:hypothetical protein
VWKEKNENGVMTETPFVNLDNEKLQECLKVIDSKTIKMKANILGFQLRINTLSLLKKSIKEIVKLRKPAKSIKVKKSI